MSNTAITSGYSRMEYTKTAVAQRASEAVEHVLNHEDALQAYVQVKAGQAYLKAVEEGLRQAALNSIHRADSAALWGAKVTAPMRTTYDYSSDASWASLDAQIAILKEQQKAREGLLDSVARLAESGGTQAFYDEETGEQVMPPRIVSQKEVLTITLAK